MRKIDPFQLLAYTGAIVPLDPFNVANPFEGIAPPFEFVLQVAGFRNYWQQVRDITKGAFLTLDPDRKNTFDPDAIEVLCENRTVGYIPKGYINSFHHWSANEQRAEIKVFRINGDTDYPYLYAFVSVAPAPAKLTPDLS